MRCCGVVVCVCRGSLESLLFAKAGLEILMFSFTLFLFFLVFLEAHLKFFSTPAFLRKADSLPDFYLDFQDDCVRQMLRTPLEHLSQSRPKQCFRAFLF